MGLASFPGCPGVCGLSVGFVTGVLESVPNVLKIGPFNCVDIGLAILID